MKNTEIEDLDIWVNGTDKDRERLYLKYLDTYEDHLKSQESNYAYVKPEELRSDAVMAIKETFDDLDRRVERMIKNYKSNKIILINEFKKHFKKIARENQRENLPLTHEIRMEYSKTVRKSTYTNYKKTDNSVAVETLFSDEHSFSDSNGKKLEIKQLLRVAAPDEHTDVFKDVCMFYVDGHTLETIAKEPRNDGVSKQAISKRMKRHLAKLHKRIKLDEFSK